MAKKTRRDLTDVIMRPAVYKCGCRRQVVGYPAEVYKELQEAFLWPCPVCSPVCRPLLITGSQTTGNREDVYITFRRSVATESAAAGAEQQELF